MLSYSSLDTVVLEDEIRADLFMCGSINATRAEFANLLRPRSGYCFHWKWCENGKSILWNITLSKHLDMTYQKSITPSV